MHTYIPTSSPGKLSPGKSANTEESAIMEAGDHFLGSPGQGAKKLRPSGTQKSKQTGFFFRTCDQNLKTVLYKFFNQGNMFLNGKKI